MTDADKTIYKICREQAEYTQERAAELLSCCALQRTGLSQKWSGPSWMRFWGSCGT